MTNTFSDIRYVKFELVFIYCRRHFTVGRLIANCMESKPFICFAYYLFSVYRKVFQNCVLHSTEICSVRKICHFGNSDKVKFVLHPEFRVTIN